MRTGLIALLIALLAVYYIASYYRYPHDVHILQTSADHFTFDMLREKQPLVIEDQVQDGAQLVAKWFSPNLVTPFSLDASETWHKNRYKYVVLHAQSEGDIYVYPPNKRLQGDVPDPQEALVAIHLTPFQVLLLPLHYRYLIAPPMKVTVYGAHDYITYMLP
jgi:hypothetical protein